MDVCKGVSRSKENIQHNKIAMLYIFHETEEEL